MRKNLHGSYEWNVSIMNMNWKKGITIRLYGVMFDLIIDENLWLMIILEKTELLYAYVYDFKGWNSFE